jgi:hypothetical protein
MSTDLVLRTTAREMVGLRDAALSDMALALDALEAAVGQAHGARELAARAHGNHQGNYRERDRDALGACCPPVDRERSLAAFRRDLDTRCWLHLMDVSGIADMMDRTAKEELDADLAADVPEFTEATVLATFERLPAVWMWSGATSCPTRRPALSRGRW